MDANIYYPDEIVFLKKNFFNLTNQQLLDEINSKRSDQIRLPGLMHLCRKLGLRRGVQIRWSDEDIQFLKNNFRKYGDKELSIKLTKRRKTFRVIDDKKTFRTFTNRHVEKKRKLLGLKRTEDEVFKIRKRNIETGLSPAISSEDNLWSRGVRKAASEEEIRTWKCNGRLHNFIKIDGKFIPYSTWIFTGPVPPGFKVYHIDMDTINDEPDNLECKPAKGTSMSDYKRALPLIQKRLKAHQDTKYPTAFSDQREWNRKLNYLKALQHKIETKIARIEGSKHYLKKKAIK